MSPQLRILTTASVSFTSISLCKSALMRSKNYLSVSTLPPIHGITIWAKIQGYDEEFQLAQFDVVPAFTEYHRTLPMLTESKRYITRSEKEIQIMANPHLAAADFSLKTDFENTIS